jgi:hypothetical protein
VATGRVARARVDEERAGDGVAAEHAGEDRAATERAADRAATERAETGAPVASGGTDSDGRPDTVVDRDHEVPVAPAGPRPRTSLLATLSLIVGVAAAFFVLSGTLAGYGIALGAIAVVLGFAGMAGTRRRHVAGKADALLGIGIGAAALVIGILAMTGSFAWPTTAGDWDMRLRHWLDAQTVNRF